MSCLPSRRTGGWLRALAVSLAATGCALHAAEDELILSAEVTRTDVPATAFVILSQPDARLQVPEGACLEYDIFFGADNVSFGGGIVVATRKGSVITEPCYKDQEGVDTHFARGAAGLEKRAKGRWYHRTIAIGPITGAPLTELFAAASAGTPRATGRNEIRYRNIRLTDGKGTMYANLMPTLGSLPWPLNLSAPYVHKVEVKAPAVSGGFLPATYLTASDQPLRGEIQLRNFDPASPATVAYELFFERLDGAPAALPPTKGEATLEPGALATVPVELPAPPPGDYRPRLRLTTGGKEAIVPGYALSSRTPEQLAARRAPLAPGGFGMGAVALSGGMPLATLPALREQGANYIQLRMNWSQLEPEEGRYNLELLAPYLDMARRCGLWVQVDLYSGYPAYTVPKWYWKDSMVSNTGKKTLPSNLSLAYWTEGRRQGLKLLGALRQRYGSLPELVAFNAWLGGNMDGFYLIRGTPQDAGLQDYSASSQAKFREYVRDVLKLSLKDAAARYGLTLTTWDDLTQPDPKLGELNLDPYWYDFMRYRLWSVSQVEREASEVIDQADAKVHVEYLYGGGLGYLGRNGNDFDAGVVNARKFTGSMHHTASPGAQNQVYLGTARRLFNVPFSIETAGTPASPPDHQHAIFELLSQDASAYTYIQSAVWGSMPVPGAAYGFGEFRPALERAQGAMPTGPSVAVVFPYSDQIIDPFGTQLEGTKAAAAFIRRMETVGYDADLLTDRTPDVPWSRYPVVIAWFSSALEPPFVRAMTDYVSQGGKLILLPGTGLYTPGVPEKRFALLKALGAEPREAEPALQIGRPAAVFQRDGLKDLEAPLTETQPLAGLPKDAVVWATDKAGQPAVATWAHGKGQVMVWAGRPASWTTPASAQPVRYGSGGSSATVATVFPTAFDRVLEQFAGTRLPLTCVTPDVLFALRQKDGDRFLILFNNSEAQATARLRVPLPAGSYHTLNLTRPGAEGAPLEASDTEAELAVELEPLEVAVVQVSPTPIAAPDLDFPPRLRAVPPPDGALSGAALAERFTPTATLLADSPAVRVAEGARLRLALPASGLFELSMQVPAGGTAPDLRDASGRTLAMTSRTTAGGTRHHAVWTATGRDATLTVARGGEITWLGTMPAFSPLGEAHVSPAQSNPGKFPGKLFAEAGPLEQQLLATGTVPGDAGWHTVTPQPDGTLDLAEITGKPDGLAYVVWTLDAPQKGRALLGLGVDYGLKLWLNGQPVFDSTQERRGGPPKANEFLVPVELRVGRNVFVGKVAAGSHGWTVQANINLKP